jgi:hypothetical protein
MRKLIWIPFLIPHMLYAPVCSIDYSYPKLFELWTSHCFGYPYVIDGRSNGYEGNSYVDHTKYGIHITTYIEYCKRKGKVMEWTKHPGISKIEAQQVAYELFWRADSPCKNDTCRLIFAETRWASGPYGVMALTKVYKKDSSIVSLLNHRLWWYNHCDGHIIYGQGWINRHNSFKKIIQ